MIVNIRGTNGSGKSTVARALIGMAQPAVPVYGVLGPRQPEAYRLALPGCVRSAAVLGPYLAPTGGCDCLASYAQLVGLLEKYRRTGHVVFEGAWLSDAWGRVGAYLDGHSADVLLAFMDTPLDVCLQRLTARRVEACTLRSLSAKTSKRYQDILRVRRKVEGRIRTMDVSSETGAQVIMEVLCGAG